MINDFSSDEEEEEEEEEKEVFGSEASSSSFDELEQRCFTISYPSTEILLPPFSRNSTHIWHNCRILGEETIKIDRPGNASFGLSKKIPLQNSLPDASFAAALFAFSHRRDVSGRTALHFFNIGRDNGSPDLPRRRQELPSRSFHSHRIRVCGTFFCLFLRIGQKGFFHYSPPPP